MWRNNFSYVSSMYGVEQSVNSLRGKKEMGEGTQHGTCVTLTIIKSHLVSPRMICY